METRPEMGTGGTDAFRNADGRTRTERDQTVRQKSPGFQVKEHKHELRYCNHRRRTGRLYRSRTGSRRRPENVLFEKNAIGGVCLNEGCIPTKNVIILRQDIGQFQNILQIWHFTGRNTVFRHGQDHQGGRTGLSKS